MNEVLSPPSNNRAMGSYGQSVVVVVEEADSSATPAQRGISTETSLSQNSVSPQQHQRRKSSHSVGDCCVNRRECECECAVSTKTRRRHRRKQQESPSTVRPRQPYQKLKKKTNLLEDSPIDPMVQHHMHLPLTSKDSFNSEILIARQHDLLSFDDRDQSDSTEQEQNASAPIPRDTTSLRFDGAYLQTDVVRCMQRWNDDHKKGIQSKRLHFATPPLTRSANKRGHATFNDISSSLLLPSDVDDIPHLERQTRLLIMEQQLILQQIQLDRNKEDTRTGTVASPNSRAMCSTSSRSLPTRCNEAAVDDDVARPSTNSSKTFASALQPRPSKQDEDEKASAAADTDADLPVKTIQLNGHAFKLKSQDSVRNALKNGSGMKKIQCPICRKILLMTDQASTVFCPVCHTLSAAD